jgi:hypothetical protein
MRVFSTLSAVWLALGLFVPSAGLLAQEVSKESPAKGMPPRAAPSEYQTQATAGMVTIAAEFMGHAVPTPEQTVASDDYVVLDVGIYGPPGARVMLSRGDFSLRINGKKMPVSSEPYELVFKSLRDPEWQPPVPQESKSKGGVTTGGGGGGGDKLPPVPPKMPFELRRTMEQHVQRAAMQEGDRALPQAGLLFFAYRGKAEGIHSIELIYSGAAGNATLTLQP